MKKMARRLLACAVSVAILVACTISGWVLPAMAEDAPTNLIANGDFENGKPGWGWTFSGYSAIVDGVGYNGTKGLQLKAGTSSSGGTSDTGRIASVTLSADTTYILRYMVKGGASQIYASTSGTFGFDTQLKSPETTDWIQQEVFLKPTADFFGNIDLALYYNTTTAVYYDNFELYEYEEGMNIVPGSDGGALAGSARTAAGTSATTDACDYLFFADFVAAGKTISVATDPDDAANKVWELSADSITRYLPMHFSGYSLALNDVYKVSFRYKGKNGEVPTCYVTNIANATNKFSFELQRITGIGPDENGWYTAITWLNIGKPNSTYNMQALFKSTNGVYLDDFTIRKAKQCSTGETNNVTIQNVSAMQFAQSEVPLAVGQTALIYPQGKFGEEWDANAYCGTLTWTSSDTSVATVNKTTGLVKMVSSTPNATATITATSSVTGAPAASYTVKMTVVEPTAIKINKEQVTLLGAGATETLSVVGTAPANSSVIPEKVTWTSSDTSVATVDANGVVTAVYSGDKVKTATITAKYEGIDTPATATVTVNNNLMPDDVFASVTENTDVMTKYDNGGYHNKPYISLAAPAEGAITSYAVTVNLQRPMKAGKRYILSTILKGSLSGLAIAGTSGTITSIRWNDASDTAGDSWVEARNINNGATGYVFVPTADATSLTVTFYNAPYGMSNWGADGTASSNKIIEACFSDLKLFEYTDEVNLLSGAAGDLVGQTQRNLSVTTKKDSAGDEWFYIKSTIQYPLYVYNTSDYLSKIYEYSVKYKPADANNGKFYSYHEDNPRKNGHVVSTKQEGPDADGWYTYTAWIELLPASPNFNYATSFRVSGGPVYTKDWSCYLVPKAEKPFYGANKLLTPGSQTNLASAAWLGAVNANAQWTIADESVIAFTAGNGPITASQVTIKAKALGTTTVTVKDATSSAAPVTILVKVLPSTAGDYAVNFNTPNADVSLKDINGNALNSLITGAIISVKVKPNNGYIPTPGTLRYVTADGVEHRMLNRTEIEGTENSFMMQVPEGAFTVKIDMASTAQTSFTAGTIGTAYRELDGQQQGDKVDGIRFLTRVYIEGFDLTGDKITIKYNGTEYEVESMGTLLKRAANTTALTLDNVGGSGAATIWRVENYNSTDKTLSVSAYSNNSLDFAATMTTSNPSETFKERKYTSRGYIKLKGVDEVIYTTPRTDSAADAQKRATGDLTTSTTKYGVKWSTTDPDDLGARCFDAEGLEAVIGVGDVAGRSDFDTIYPWSGMVRCNIKEGANGEDVVIYEGEPGFALDGSNGNVFVRIPKFSVQKYTEDGYEYRVITGDDTQLHPAFIEDGKVLDAIYVGAFEGYINEENKLSSIGGVIPTNNETPVEFLAAAQENGVRYTLYDNRSLDALWTLVTVEYGCRNTNQIWGYGVADYMQPDDLIHLLVREDATATNTVSIRQDKSGWYAKMYMPVGSTITICRGTQENIITQRKILKIEDKDGYTQFTFDGDPIDLIASEFGLDENGNEIATVVNDFIGSAPLYTNYVEDCPEGGMTTWHTGRANWIVSDATNNYREKAELTGNPIRYRWIENVVGNLWHFLPDVTFKNGEMYTCNNIRDYEICKADGISYVSTGLTFENNYYDNGSKSDITGKNYWVTSLIDDSGHLFGDAYNKELLSNQAFGAYYYVKSSGESLLLNGGGFDHLWRCNMLTNRGWATADTNWYLYGSRLMYKQIQE